jgi:hypothetical protein
MSAASRRTKKLLARSNWFRSSKEVAETGEESSHLREEQPRVARPPARSQARGVAEKRGAKPGANTRQELRTTTVLFVEFSKGGSLQKCMRGVLDNLTSMLGFKVRVTERGGTTLGSLLSNKNLWAGTSCGRGECRTCQQEGEKKEPCTTRNVVYESECGTCNPVGSRKLADKDGLAEKRDTPSLYVGETARSIMERAGEHWADGLAGKEESHMAEHQAMAHRNEQPAFNFRVVKHCSSSLERQVREAVRIQMRGLVLNKKGTFNRCKLTRLVVDTEWEDRVWKESWAPREEPSEEWEGEESLSNQPKEKRGRSEPTVAKRAKMDDEDGYIWGESVPARVAARSAFLESSGVAVPGSSAAQTRLKPISGVAWVMRELLREVANSAVTIADMMEGVTEWEEWQGEVAQQCVFPKRTEREEKYLWAMLRILDKESAGQAKRAEVKKKRAVANARKRMGADTNQPGILDAWKSSQAVVTGEVPGVVPQPTLGAEPQPLPTQVQAKAVPQPFLTKAQAHAQTDQAEQSHTLTHPISQPQECSEAFARIGLVPDEVGPKKLKTGENQQPRPAVEPLPGVVRGERGVQVLKSVVEGGG